MLYRDLTSNTPLSAVTARLRGIAAAAESAARKLEAGETQGWTVLEYVLSAGLPLDDAYTAGLGSEARAVHRDHFRQQPSTRDGSAPLEDGREVPVWRYPFAALRMAAANCAVRAW